MIKQREMERGMERGVEQGVEEGISLTQSSIGGMILIVPRGERGKGGECRVSTSTSMSTHVYCALRAERRAARVRDMIRTGTGTSNARGEDRRNRNVGERGAKGKCSS
ncbi:hypothetical protein MRB53_041978 [Persea americana]|nr:hypothetical protein MRB53_041978 [Persea americana]